MGLDCCVVRGWHGRVKLSHVFFGMLRVAVLRVVFSSAAEDAVRIAAD